MDNMERMIAEARDARHYALQPQPKLRLTPDVFGKVLFAQWASQNGRSDFPARDVVIRTLLRHAVSAPPAVKEIMQLEDRITGATIAQYTDYAQAAQADKLIKRYNPDYVRVSVEIDSLTGERLVERYTESQPEVRMWVAEIVQDLMGSREQAANEQSSEQPPGTVDQTP
jgi:hypothetical protein